MDLPPNQSRTKSRGIWRRPEADGGFLTFTLVALIVRLFLFVSRYAVNILYWDEWKFYSPLFQNLGPWQLFRSQDGIQYGGLGMLAAAVLARLTGWNSRADAFAVAAFVCLAMLLALVLKWLIFRRIDWPDVAIPMLFLTLFQFETWVIMPVLWSGALPVLLIMLYCLALQVRRAWLRTGLILALNFLLVFTGNGMFMGIVTVLLLGGELWQTLRAGRRIGLTAAALGAALVTDLLFFVSYRFQPAVAVRFSAIYLLQYPAFVGLMLAAFWGWHTLILGSFVPLVAGALLLVVSLWILVVRVTRVIRDGIYADRLSLVVIVLVSFTLIFCLTTAVGRISLGLRQAQVSRYLTLLIPGYLGWYFHLADRPRTNVRTALLAVFLAISSVGSLPLGVVDAQAFRVYESKLAWKECYLQLESIQTCNRISGRPIFPGADNLPEKLAYLKEHRLNLFLDGPR